MHIAGYALTVETERSEEHMDRLAELLNDRVREVQKSSRTTNYLHAVMMAAMKLADEVLELRGARESEKESIERRNRDLLAALDGALQKVGKAGPGPLPYA